MSGRRPAPRLARPAVRYWQGKAPRGVDAAGDSDSDDEQPRPQEEDQEVSLDEDEDEDEDDHPLPKVAGTSKPGMNIALRDVNISKEGKVTVAGREESGKTEAELQQQEEETSSEEEDEDVKPGVKQASSSEYETDSEEEEPAAPQFRPVFVAKDSRKTVEERDAELAASEEAANKRDLAAQERKKQSHDLVAETIKRELAEKEVTELIPDVDDTDGLDPKAEFEAWRIRELGRIKRDKEVEVQREEERLEIERRRAMPEKERLKEDLERANKSREEKPKGQQKFLQKYWHKGAFHQDADILKRHDFTEATESTVDVSLLPKVMQVKDFGKRSRTKYTHLVDQDTTIKTGGFGGVAPTRKAGDVGGASSGCFVCGGPHLKKDCPQNMPGGPRPPGASNYGERANGAPSGPRRWGGDDNGKSWKDRVESDPRRREVFGQERGSSSRREDDRGYGRSTMRRSDDRGYRRDKSRSRSRSRSPPRRTQDDHGGDRRRPRDGSPPRERKKQRVD